MKTILITGASRGIGKAVAKKFLKENYFVIGTSVSGKINFSNVNLKAIQLDLLDEASIGRFVVDVKSLGKKIDIHINNAGAIFDGDDTSVIVPKLRKTLQVNLIGAIDITERIIPLINKGGHIVHISSSAGSLAETGHSSHNMGHYPAYKISKCALNMYTRTLAMRMQSEETGITVSSVHPGWVKTDMGGEDAPMMPEEAAEYIYETAINKKLETGQFWFKGEKYPW